MRHHFKFSLVNFAALLGFCAVLLGYTAQSSAAVPANSASSFCGSDGVRVCCASELMTWRDRARWFAA